MEPDRTAGDQSAADAGAHVEPIKARVKAKALAKSFGAITRDESRSPVYTIDSIACEGCGVCSYFCQEKAIDFRINNKD